MTRLGSFVKHAARIGTDLGSAEGFDLPPLERGSLARHLRRIDSHWRLSPAKRHELASGLIAQGVKTAEIVEMTGCSYSTVSALRAVPDSPKHRRRPCSRATSFLQNQAGRHQSPPRTIP